MSILPEKKQQFMERVLNKYEKDLWKLLFDYSKQIQDAAFVQSFNEREQGYLSGMKNGLQFLKNSIKQAVTVDWVLQIHAAVTEGVQIAHFEGKENCRGHFRHDEDVSFTLLESTSSQEGIKEILLAMYNGESSYELARGGVVDEEEIEFYEYDIVNSDTISLYLSYLKESSAIKKMKSADPSLAVDDNLLIGVLAKTCMSSQYSLRSKQTASTYFYDENEGKDTYVDLQPAVVESKILDIAGYLYEKVKTYIAEYHNAINNEKDKEILLKAIATLCIKLERLHPFLDANCRVFGMLLLNRLLLENEFSPCVLDDPNCLDGFSVDQVVNEIKQGFINFQKVAKGNSVGGHVSSDEEDSKVGLDKMRRVISSAVEGGLFSSVNKPGESVIEVNTLN